MDYSCGVLCVAASVDVTQAAYDANPSAVPAVFAVVFGEYPNYPTRQHVRPDTVEVGLSVSYQPPGQANKHHAEFFKGVTKINLQIL